MRHLIRDKGNTMKIAELQEIITQLKCSIDLLNGVADGPVSISDTDIAVLLMTGVAIESIGYIIQLKVSKE